METVAYAILTFSGWNGSAAPSTSPGMAIQESLYLWAIPQLNFNVQLHVKYMFDKEWETNEDSRTPSEHESCTVLPSWILNQDVN